VNWSTCPPRRSADYFVFSSRCAEVVWLFIRMRCGSASPPFHRTTPATPSPRESLATIASHALTRYSQCPGQPSSACLRDPNACCSWQLLFLLVCLRSPPARHLRQRRSCLQVPPPLNLPTIRFSSLPLATIPCGACASDRKALSA